MILRDGELSSFSAAYSVVVLPLPVGPVTRTIPLTRLTIVRKRSVMLCGMPSFSRSRSPLSRLSRRMTTDSPSCVGIVDMRTSTALSRTSTLKRPSCGRRFSEISSPAMSFKRNASAGATRKSASVCGCSSPSMRRRMRSTSSCGSMWISDAPTWVASSNNVCSRRTTGASSAPSDALSAPKSTALSPRSCWSSFARPLISSVRR